MTYLVQCEIRFRTQCQKSSRLPKLVKPSKYELSLYPI